MDITFLIGLVGAIVLVVGAAWPVHKVSHPVKSVKNWLFAIGGLIMLTYSILNYIAGGPIFFIFLQALVNISSVLMFLDTDDKIDIPVITLAGIILVVWSLYLFEGYDTIFFIVGLVGIGLGYALKTGTWYRNFSLTLGSILIALFSFIAKDWIFFWLNTFFALFSGYYTIKLWCKK